MEALEDGQEMERPGFVAGMLHTSVTIKVRGVLRGGVGHNQPRSVDGCLAFGHSGVCAEMRSRL